MEASRRWSRCVVFLYVVTLTTVVHVSGQKYYVTLYGPNPYEGTVELSDGLSWFILHHQGWNDDNAEVTCRMLGYSGGTAKATFGSTLYNLSRPVWEFQFRCNGNETSLSECKTDRLNSTTGHILVGVECPSHSVIDYGDFLLRKTSDNQISKVNVKTASGSVNTNTSCLTDVSGQVVYDPVYDRIVYFKGSSLWGCSFGGGKTELYRFVTGMSVGPLALDTDGRILFSYSNGAISSLKLDDGSAKPAFVLNTTYASTMNVGHGEIYWVNLLSLSIERALYNGFYIGQLSAISRNSAISNFAISADNIYWSDTRMEGISTRNHQTLFRGVSPCTSLYVVGKWLYCSTSSGVLRLEKNEKCGGHFGPLALSSTQIIEHHDGLNTNQEPLCQNFYINLFGIKPNEGSIEISNGIDWLSLCSDGWDDNAAAVACRMLGYSGNGARAISNTSFPGQAHGVWPYQFHCKGDESVLSECNTSSISTCGIAGVRCSEHKDFFFKRTTKGMSKTNPLTMSGHVIVNDPCTFELFKSDVVYDSVNDQFLSFESGSLWGCRWDQGKIEIKTNTSAFSYPALDSEDRLLFGYWNNSIVSLTLDNASAEPVIVVHGTTVEKELVLDRKRNEIYWWARLHDCDNRINKVGYNGDTQVQF